MTGADSGQTGLQQQELKLTRQNAAHEFQFLWKLQLGHPTGNSESFSEPLLRQRLINGNGFKDLVYWGDADTLYAVDDELGKLEWKKHFEVSSGQSSGPCAAGNLGIAMEPPPVINFNAQRRPGELPPPQPPPVPPGERRLGMKSGGGGFGLQGIYVLTSDGYLHEQVLSTGRDFAPPVKFLPAGGSDGYGLNILGSTVFAVTAHNCGEVPNGAWAMEMTPSGYPVSHYDTQKLQPVNLSGLAIAPDGTGFLITGPGTPSGDLHPNSVIALDSKNGMKVKDWYAPSGTYAGLEHVSPVTFATRGGSWWSHRVAMAELSFWTRRRSAEQITIRPSLKPRLSQKPDESLGWEGFSAWQDKQGDEWVIASISGPLTAGSGAITSNGATPHGAYIKFRVDDDGGNPKLTPVWISRDMLNPVPAVIANDVVIALSSGDERTHAILYVLDATDGKELFSSKDEIATYTRFSGVSFGNSHAYFTDHNNTLYAFGIGMEHWLRFGQRRWMIGDEESKETARRVQAGA